MSLLRALALAFLAAPALADPLIVEVVTASAVSDTRRYALTGEIVARDAVGVSFPMEGRLSEVLAEAGDRIAAGTPLARMESVRQQQALRAAQAGLATAEADYRQAIEDLDRQDALLARGATTRIRRDAAEDALQIAEAAVAQTRADLDRTAKALNDTVLSAPARATVIRRMAEPGEVVGAAQPVMDLALGDGLDAVFEVPEAFLVGFSGVREVALSLIDRPGTLFGGRVREVSPLVDPRSGTVRVTVSVSSPPVATAYGDAVRGVVTQTSAPHIVLPYTALTNTAEGPAVWVTDPETMAVSLHAIEIERFETDRVVIRRGLENGARVVARGAHLMYPGRIVREAVQ
ncbi:RND family efflux transporter MFP subunit [Rhodovulum imhoffii]|uniref:RND family efflux transporter MFP subunit n=1 Tax=Rhodovulum imhoffii TaxID=365340 RepID=A0A2T5BSP7_9RHOB|nr:efflux RND transporter periplasmic adaptor subunit [Rhodovulum imhoffii]MBK5933052.1 hypothetical protein [Rhodovulum imhoffii]PTN02360.1 RND family efflux transporter MFP subunit [Rhodovulum imhoffii]